MKTLKNSNFKKTLIVSVIALTAGSALAEPTTTVNISGGSTSFFSATGAMAKGATMNTVDLNAAIYKDGNGVNAATSGTAQTLAQGSGNITGQSGVADMINLKLSPNHIFGEAGTAQMAKVTGLDLTQSNTMVEGKTIMHAWIDPIHVEGHAMAFSFDQAVDPMNSAGQNGVNSWLDIATGH